MFELMNLLEDSETDSDDQSIDEDPFGVSGEVPAAPRPKWKPSHRLLRGPIDVYYSTAQSFPRMHLDERCSAFEQVAATAKHMITYAGAYELGTVDSARPCRVCCLESVLRTVLHPQWGKEHPSTALNEYADADLEVFFSTTAQPCPERPDSSLSGYKWGDSTDSGRARIMRIAERSALGVAQTIIGPALYGIREQRVVWVVQMNLRTAIAPSVVTDNADGVVSTVWTLFNDNPPEMNRQNMNPVDLWATASLLAR